MYFITHSLSSGIFDHFFQLILHAVLSEGQSVHYILWGFVLIIAVCASNPSVMQVWTVPSALCLTSFNAFLFQELVQS